MKTEKEEVEQICKRNSLNITLMKNLFIWASKGYNNTDLAKKLGVHRVTIQRYSESLKEMKKEDFMKLFNYVIKEESVQNEK